MYIANFKISFIYNKKKTHEIGFCWHFQDMYAEHSKTLNK